MTAFCIKNGKKCDIERGGGGGGVNISGICVT